ncbi:unnamed protein product [Symbiodinium sp. KB8]|nr:unnamed protein product [Symbiodinium sp. KB8]
MGEHGGGFSTGLFFKDLRQELVGLLALARIRPRFVVYLQVALAQESEEEGSLFSSDRCPGAQLGTKIQLYWEGALEREACLQVPPALRGSLRMRATELSEMQDRIPKVLKYPSFRKKPSRLPVALEMAQRADVLPGKPLIQDSAPAGITEYFLDLWVRQNVARKSHIDIMMVRMITITVTILTTIIVIRRRSCFCNACRATQRFAQGREKDGGKIVIVAVVEHAAMIESALEHRGSPQDVTRQYVEQQEAAFQVMRSLVDKGAVLSAGTAVLKPGLRSMEDQPFIESLFVGQQLFPSLSDDEPPMERPAQVTAPAVMQVANFFLDAVLYEGNNSNQNLDPFWPCRQAMLRRECEILRRLGHHPHIMSALAYEECECALGSEMILVTRLASEGDLSRLAPIGQWARVLSGRTAGYKIACGQPKSQLEHVQGSYGFVPSEASAVDSELLFDSDCWEPLSSMAKDFAVRLLSPDPAARGTASELLSGDKWLQADEAALATPLSAEVHRPLLCRDSAKIPVAIIGFHSLEALHKEARALQTGVEDGSRALGQGDLVLQLHIGHVDGSTFEVRARQVSQSLYRHVHILDRPSHFSRRGFLFS